MIQKKNTVLIVEDELPIRKVQTIALDSAGYNVMECDNGKDGIRITACANPDLILLDLGLPDMDGLQMIAGVREWSRMPIIVCSVRRLDEEIIKTLEAGADDYVTKPFNSDILIARVKANLRKTVTTAVAPPALVNGAICMDMVRHEVYVDNEKRVFTPKEYELLRYFLINRGKMLTHRQILKEVWGNMHAEDMQYLRVYVSQLREKIEADPADPRYLVTQSGVGYRMEVVPTCTVRTS